ncbi:MAG: chalcone isomerase family protein [Pseudomonadota bacterium]
MRQILVAMWLLLLRSSGAMAGPLEVEGVSLNDTATISGKQLVLNVAGFHKRGYFKAYVTGLYLSEKRASLDAINKLSSPNASTSMCSGKFQARRSPAFS